MLKSLPNISDFNKCILYGNNNAYQVNCIRISFLPLQLQKIQIYSTDSQLWIPIVQLVFLCHKYDDKTNFDTFWEVSDLCPKTCSAQGTNVN